jgi:transcriptional regulator with XRE-family HTH domain
MGHAMSTHVIPETAPTIPAGHSQGSWDMAREQKAGQETPGARLARLRRDKGITQIELAERLGVTQSVVSDYERDVLRLNSELIMQLIEILGVSADELLGVARAPATNGPIKNRRLYRQLQNIEKLPKRDQQALLRTIDAFLAKAS